jgi:hypothetical protein
VNEVSSIFIANLKLGDNIKYNIDCLNCLYSKGVIKQAKFIKFAIITEVSIIEAVMVDFIRRVKVHTREFQYLDEKTRKQLRNLKSDNPHWKFDESIKKFRHFRIIGNPEVIYKELDYFRTIRNKVHIHNLTINKNERILWDYEHLIRAERILEYTLKYMCNNYPRPLNEDFIGGFKLPWQPHYTNSIKW